MGRERKGKTGMAAEDLPWADRATGACLASVAGVLNGEEFQLARVTEWTRAVAEPVRCTPLAN